MRWNIISVCTLLLAFVCHATTSPAQAAAPSSIQPGGLFLLTEDQPAAACPLEHTEVQVDIAGFVARTTVRQTFVNPFEEKIEALYIFPLAHGAAVDSMVMHVGDRRVVGRVAEREEARRIYNAARSAGHLAGLLDSERPNVFTQSVANIEPGETVVIEIGFVETLTYEDGQFEWVFPMVVGPRYIPGGGSAPAPMQPGRPTPQVPDADRVTPPVTPPGTRSGHDISLTVEIDAGTEILELHSELHEIDVELFGNSATRVRLAEGTTIPNRDFVLRYRLATDEISHTFLTHEDPRGNFFTLILQPPRRVDRKQALARELIFVVDTSGSMRGMPLDKGKQLISGLIDTMGADDTFNLITFSGSTRILWDSPRPSSAENRRTAQAFLAGQSGGGGTEMMRAIDAALTQADQDNGRTRIVCFLTDGYVGNDMAIIDRVRHNARTTRVFSFGVGNSVNRFLLDGMAHAGRGAVEYVTLASQADAAVKRFHQRVLAPVLTDIEIDWGGLPVQQLFPQRVPDLFGATPILIHGRLTGEADAVITVRGRTVDGPYEKSIRLRSASSPDHRALASLWARAKLRDLMNRNLAAVQRNAFPDELKQQIVDLGVEYGLATRFTSFVAVEELTVTVGGEPRLVRVPVEMPEGVSYEGVFGGSSRGATTSVALPSMAAPPGKLFVRTANLSAQVSLEQDAADVPHPPTVLAEALVGLAEKVERLGADGALEIDGLTVVDHRVDVMLRLTELNEATRRQLAQLGFQTTAHAARILIGTIDVRRLDELARISAVISVDPLPSS